MNMSAPNDPSTDPVIRAVRPELAVDPQRPPARQEPKQSWIWVVRGFVQLGVASALVALGVVVYNVLIATGPVAKKGDRPRVARLVEVATVDPTRSGPIIRAWGEVEPAQTLIVRPEIAGRLEWVHPDVTPGGLLRSGTEVARLDPTDLEFAVLQARADIADVEARILIEQGQAAIGERELSRLSRNLSEAQKSLVLRKPQMAQLEAELDAAEASLKQAENALTKTRVVAPFDAVVLTESVAPGTMLTTGMEAATLIPVDRYHVVLRVSGAALDWIPLDGSQSVTLTHEGIWPDGAVREGSVVRLNAGLSETGRMAELIVEISDPLALQPENAGKPKVLLGSFLEGRIEAALTGVSTADVEAGQPVIRIDRSNLRDNDTVWIFSEEETLDIREVEVLWRGPETVLISAGLSPGDQIVTTPLPTYTKGMKLRTRGGR